MTTPSFLQELVRHFPENSAKFLLQTGANTHDLLALVEEPAAADLDHALMYHARPVDEREACYAAIDDAVQTDPRRKDVRAMTRTIAEALKEGRVEGERLGILRSLRETLLRRMRKRFKRVPRKVGARYEPRPDVAVLQTW